MKTGIVGVFVRTCVLLVMGMSSLCAQHVKLVYKFKSGQVDRYKEMTRTTMSSEAMPGGSQTFTNETFSTLKTDKVNSDGGAEIVRTIDSTSSTMNGKQFENPRTQGATGFPLRVKVSSTGKVLEVQAIKDSLDETSEAILEAFRSQLMSQPSFPATPVTINASWHDSTTLIQQTQMGTLTTEIKYSTALVGSDTIAGVKVRVLKMNMSLSGAIEGGAGTISGTGGGNVYFSDESGKEIKSTLDVDQTMNMNSPRGSMTMTMKTTTTRELMK